MRNFALVLALIASCGTEEYSHTSFDRTTPLTPEPSAHSRDANPDDAAKAKSRIHIDTAEDEATAEILDQMGSNGDGESLTGETDLTPPDVKNSDDLDPAANGDPNVVVFRIAAGTGKSPWNSESESLLLKRGQILRLVNDDTITHRLHTNGAPCPHGVNFAPGQSYDCVARTTFDASAGKPLYDHIAGTSAEFWLKVQP